MDDDMTKQLDCGIHKFSDDNIKTIPYQQELNEVFQLPTLDVEYIRREDIKIKYLSRKHVVHFLPSI